MLDQVINRFVFWRDDFILLTILGKGLTCFCSFLSILDLSKKNINRFQINHFKMTFSSQNRFPSSHLISGMALLFFCCVTALPTSERSLNSDSTSSSQISSQLLPEDRRSHCGLQTVKILSLLCSNDFKYQLDQMNKGKQSSCWLSPTDCPSSSWLQTFFGSVPV